MTETQFDEIKSQLNKIIQLLEKISKPPSLPRRILDTAAAVVGVLGIIGVLDFVKKLFD